MDTKGCALVERYWKLNFPPSKFDLILNNLGTATWYKYLELMWNRDHTPPTFLKRKKKKWDRIRVDFPMGFPCGSAGKESACNAGDLGSIPGLGGSPGEGKGYPLQYLSWKIPLTVQSIWLQRVRHGWSNFHFHLPNVKTWRKKKLLIKKRDLATTIVSRIG